MVQGLPRWLRGNEPACSEGDAGLSPGSGRLPWRRKWQLTLIFLLENPIVRGVWEATAHGLVELDSTKSLPPRGDLGVTSGETGRRQQHLRQWVWVGEADSLRANGATEALFHRHALRVRGASRYAKMQRCGPRQEDADHTAQG